MMQGEKIATDLREAQEACPAIIRRSRRCRPPCAGWSAAPVQCARRLIEPAVKAIDVAINALEEADQHLARRADRCRFRSCGTRAHRGAAVRAARRRAQIFDAGRSGCAALAAKYFADVATDRCRRRPAQGAGERGVARPTRRYSAAATRLSAARIKSAEKLNKAVNRRARPLKLERAKFITQVDSDAATPGPHGIDRVEFWVQTNPGTRPGPMMKVASGGELSRFLLALKVVLSDKGSAPTLVFDEIDTGVGGARWPTPSARAWRGSPARSR